MANLNNLWCTEVLKFWSGFECMNSLKETCIHLSVLKANQVLAEACMFLVLLTLYGFVNFFHFM